MKKTMFAGLTILTILFAGNIYADTPQKASVNAIAGLGGCQGNCSGIDPSLGAQIGGYYNVQNNIGVGGNFRFQHYGTGAGSINSYMIGPELTYLFSVDPKFSIYGSGGFGFDLMKFEYDSSVVSASADDKAIYIRVGLGGLYQINKEFSAGLGLSYQVNFWKDSSGSFNDYLIGLEGRYNIF